MTTPQLIEGTIAEELAKHNMGATFSYRQAFRIGYNYRALLAQPSVAPPAPGGDVLERRSETGMPMSANAPEKCPITRRPFFMVISHPDLGWVPTYGGPYDSYTIPHMEGKPDEPYHERELTCHHYDHDYGGWVDDESIPMRVINEGVLNALQSTQAPTALQVWYGSTPESNGRTNWTAILHRGDLSEGFTLARSEHPQRVRYGADCVRHLIGELPDEPDVLAYDGDELTPCHLCGGSGIKDGKPCWGLNFEGTVHNAPTAQGQDAAPADSIAAVKALQQAAHDELESRVVRTIAEALRAHGLSLLKTLKTVNGYEVRKLGRAVAQADAAPAEQTQTVELLDERGEIRRDLKSSAYCVGNEYKPFHPSASHVRPEWRDGWNACFVAAIKAQGGKQ